jgi:transposase
VSDSAKSRERQRRGRPSKLTQELQEKICGALRTGASIETAAAHAGVHRDTVYDWLRRGEEEAKGPHAAFVESARKAQSDCEMACLAMIKKDALNGSLPAATWLLERRFPGQWGRRDRHEVDATVKSTMEVTADDAVQELARLLAAGAAGGGTKPDP